MQRMMIPLLLLLQQIEMNDSISPTPLDSNSLYQTERLPTELVAEFQADGPSDTCQPPPTGRTLSGSSG